MRKPQEIQKIEKSYAIVWAGMLALHLAVERKRKAIGIEEYFSGLYLIARDALVPYWAKSDSLDEFVRNVCGLTEPVWFYWIDYYHALKNKYAEGIMGPYSKELADVLNYSAHFALKMKRNSRQKPQLEMEHLLTALVAHPKLQFTRRLIASGISLRRLTKGMALVAAAPNTAPTESFRKRRRRMARSRAGGRSLIG